MRSTGPRDPVRPHQVRESTVSVTGRRLRPVHRLVDPRGRPANGESSSMMPCVALVDDQRRRRATSCDGARIDHRIRRATGPRLEADGVERLAAGLAPTLLRTASRPRSTRTSARTNGFDIDWIVNSTVSSPTDQTLPRGPTTASPRCSGSTAASSGMYEAGAPLGDRTSSSAPPSSAVMDSTARP